MAIVEFYSTTKAKYDNIGIKNDDALYFLDNGQLYKGETLIGNGIEIVDTYPTTGVAGIIYVKPSNGGAKIWTGSAYIDLVLPMSSAVNSSSTHNQIPSAKAVWDALAAITPDGYEEFQNKVTALEEALTGIQDPTNGILAQAKAYTDELANGQVTENKNAIVNLSGTKADKASTLAGYGITNAYTKDEVNTAIQTAVANSEHLKREIVTALPSVATADTNTIYMLKVSDTSSTNRYKEYMVINGVWELIGTSDVDLTGYATTEEVKAAKEEAIETAATDATNKAGAAQAAVEAQLETYKTSNDKAVSANTTAIANINNETTGILAQAKKYADNLGANYATKEQGAKADTALQQADITSGAAAGTIAVKGQDIAVTGLQSAAYSKSTDFDAAGSANAALNNAKSYTDEKLTWKTIG